MRVMYEKRESKMREARERKRDGVFFAGEKDGNKAKWIKRGKVMREGWVGRKKGERTKGSGWRMGTNKVRETKGKDGFT